MPFQVGDKILCDEKIGLGDYVLEPETKIEVVGGTPFDCKVSLPINDQLSVNVTANRKFLEKHFVKVE